MNQSRGRRGLSLSKHIKSRENRTLTNSSFSQSRSFIDRVLPDENSKQSQPDIFVGDQIYRSFLVQCNQKRRDNSKSELDKANNDSKSIQKFKSFEANHQPQKQSVRAPLKVNTTCMDNEHRNLNLIIHKLSCELQSINVQAHSMNASIEQINEKHKLRMTEIAQKKENLRLNIQKQKELKKRAREPKLHKTLTKSNISDIQELNLKIGNLIMEIQLTFEG